MLERRRTSLPFVVVGLGLFIFLSILTFFVNKSNTVKRSIVTANALEFNRAYTGATIHTSIGDIEIEFIHKSAPQAIFNFIELSDKKFYDGTKFHYVLKNFLVQGGDPFSRGNDKSLYGTGGPGYTLPKEKNSEPMERGVVAMATLGNDTSGSQFFILTAPELPSLSGKFSVFAKINRGFDVLDKINEVPTDENIPRYPITVDSIQIQ